MKIAIGAAIIFVILGLAGFVPRYIASANAKKAASERSTEITRVQVVTPKALTSQRALSLPGTVKPLEETTLYPRAAGYVRRWVVDIGDKVKVGQLMAEIDTPELDDQLAQARAGLAEAQAQALRAQATKAFSTTALERYKELTPQGVTSQQDLDQRQAQAHVDAAGVTVSSASVDAQKANVRRLEHLKEFSRITAPFDGTVVERFAQRGALVSTAAPLFRVASLDPVRVFVQVPQNVAPSMRNGVPVTVSVREYGDRKFLGQVSRSAGALDETTRTMTTEALVPNQDGALLSGMYARVSIELPAPHLSYEVPTTALLSDAQGTRIALVDEQNKITLRKIEIENDMGSVLHIAAGLTGDERVVKVAGAHLRDGIAVTIVD